MTTDLVVLGNQLSALGSALATTVTIPTSTGQRVYTCPACSAIASAVNPAAQQVTSLSSPGGVVNTLQSTMDTINQTLVSIAQSIGTQINTSRAQLNDAQGKVAEYKSQVTSSTETVNNGDNMRNLGVLVLLLLPCISVVVIIIGGACKWGHLFTLNYLILYLTCMLMFLLFAIHLPVALVFADGCNYLDANLANVSNVMPGQAGTGFFNKKNGSVPSLCGGSHDSLCFGTVFCFFHSAVAKLIFFQKKMPSVHVFYRVYQSGLKY
jgi:hypothetical protein